MKLTVGIASYNAEDFVETALNSLVAQTMTKSDFEVVLVDDCSTDATIKKAEQYKDKLNLNCIVLPENSGGPGHPRNTAIVAAKGEYILFLDVDDYLHPDTLTDCWNCIAANESDVVLLKYKGVNGRGVAQSMFKETVSKTNIMGYNVIYTLGPSKVFRTSLLRENEIYFPTNIKTAEDQIFTMRAYLKARVISILSDKDYYYLVLHEGDHMSVASVPPEAFYDIMRQIMHAITTSNFTESEQYEIGRLFLDRHLQFSRTKNLSVKYKKIETSQHWFAVFSAFIRETVPVGVDEIIDDRFKLLLYYARSNDFDGYRKIEQMYRSGRVSRITTNSKQLLYTDNTQQYDISNLLKPQVKLKGLTAKNERFHLCIAAQAHLQFNDIHTDITLKLVTRAKTMTQQLFPVKKSGADYHFVLSFEDLLSNDAETERWDLFIEFTVGSYTVTRRVGHNRTSYEYPSETSAISIHKEKNYRLTPYFTETYDNLSFHVAPLAASQAVFKLEKETQSIIKLVANKRNFFIDRGMSVCFSTGRENVLGFVDKVVFNEEGHTVITVQVTRYKRLTHFSYCVIAGVTFKLK